MNAHEFAFRIFNLKCAHYFLIFTNRLYVLISIFRLEDQWVFHLKSYLIAPSAFLKNFFDFALNFLRINHRSSIIEVQLLICVKWGINNLILCQIPDFNWTLQYFFSFKKSYFGIWIHKVICCDFLCYS